MTAELIIEKQGYLRILTLNRPQRLNAINPTVIILFEEILKDLKTDKDARVLIITGAGRAFCAGADIKAAFEPGAEKMLERPHYNLFNMLEDLEIPVIAAINGPANGGGLELALCCDFRLASESASFGFGEVKLGSLPSMGGTVRLPRLIGLSAAKQMLFLGHIISAEEALQLGLVDRVIPTSTLMEESINLAKQLLKNAPMSLKMIKSCINIGMQMPAAAAFDYEIMCFNVLSKSEDWIEGRRAFVEKRSAEFKNH